MKQLLNVVCLFLMAMAVTGNASAQQLYDPPAGDSRWISFENPTGQKGKAAMENKGAKGNASQWIAPGTSRVLMDYEGAGVISRIWMTVIDKSPAALRSIRIEMYWDGAQKPAVSVPLGDFFGIGLGKKVPFQNALFSDPEGRSFNCNIPMPFKKHAKIVFVNESKANELLFYDINFTSVKKHPKEILYFHAYWGNNDGGQLGEDFEILPKVTGKGRFLGSNLSIIPDKVYGDLWFGEGEVKAWLDGDTQHPTLAGTGTEDYIGSAWNLGPYAQWYQGAPIVDKQKGLFAFYRYHIPDPIWFQTDCRITLQQMGGGGRDLIRAVIKKGGKAKPISVMTPKGLIKLLEEPSYPDLFDDAFPKDEWVNFYRVDDYSATAYFYLDKPENNLPPLAPLSQRLKGIQ